MAQKIAIANITIFAICILLLDRDTNVPSAVYNTQIHLFPKDPHLKKFNYRIYKNCVNRRLNKDNGTDGRGSQQKQNNKGNSHGKRCYEYQVCRLHVMAPLVLYCVVLCSWGHRRIPAKFFTIALHANKNMQKKLCYGQQRRLSKYYTVKTGRHRVVLHLIVFRVQLFETTKEYKER